MRVRAAEGPDLARLRDIEAAADQMFAPVMEIDHWGTPATGRDRAESGGQVFVIGEPAVGFVHVIEIDGHFHLEQLAVHPDHGRRGFGTALVYAAAEAIAERGGESMSLLTFADVPWNAPFYRRLGFEIVDPAPDYLMPAIEHEKQLGLKRGGPRVAMARAIAPLVEARPAVSVIPIRDGEHGLEVYVQHRVHTMDFAPGAVVFPGGRVDSIDTTQASDVADKDLDELAEIWRDSSYVCNSVDPRLAVRVLLATGIREMAEETGVRLSPSEVLPWDDWTTPPAFPKRFQVHFMVVHLPMSDPRSPYNTTTEAFESEWLPVLDVLARGDGGDLQLMTPTRVILRELADLGSASAILNAHPDVTPVHNDRAGVRPRPPRRARSMTEG